MAKKPNYSLKNNRWLYVGFVALGVMAVWFGVMLGNFLLNRVANADPVVPDNVVTSSTPDDTGVVEPPTSTVAADYPDYTTQNSGSVLFRVRVGTYSTLSQANSAAANLQASGFETYVIGSGTGPYYVQVGAFKDRNNADTLAGQIEDKGYEVYIMQ